MPHRTTHQSSSRNYYAVLGEEFSLDDSGDDSGESTEPDAESGDQVQSAATQISYSDCKFQIQHYNHSGESTPEEHMRLFHQACSKCLSTPIPYVKRLCGRCQHVRLRHILQSHDNENPYYWDMLSFGTVQDLLTTRKFCSLCRFLNEVISKNAPPGVVRNEEALDGNTLCLLKRALNIGRALRPGGLNVSLCFRIKPATVSDSEDIPLHFRSLDGSALSSRRIGADVGDFWYHEVPSPVGTLVTRR